MKRDEIDFHAVAWEHRAIDERLTAWARWVKGGRRLGGACAPMFRLYRASSARSIEPVSAPILPDEQAALVMERAVRELPEGPREAVRWAYVSPYVSPGKVARYLGVPMADLPALVHEGRELLSKSA